MVEYHVEWGTNAGFDRVERMVHDGWHIMATVEDTIVLWRDTSGATIDYIVTVRFHGSADTVGAIASLAGVEGVEIVAPEPVTA